MASKNLPQKSSPPKKKSLKMNVEADKRKKVRKQAESKKLIAEPSDDEESDEEESVKIAAFKEAAKEKWNELLRSLVFEHAAKKKKNAAGKIVEYSAPKLKKKKTISVTECSTSEKKRKGKRPAIEMDSESDFEDSYSKMALVRQKKVKKEKVKCEDEGLKQEVRINEPKSIKIRMSPRNLKKVLENLRSQQVEELRKMGFGEFHNNFNFYSIPSELGFWVVRNFDSETCSITMNDGRKIKITRELVRDMLGIPMGDMKVEALAEKNLYEETTAKWREIMESIVVKKKIYISKLEEHLCSLTEVDWEFRVAFLVLFFSIFGQGNKDGEVNERIIPILSNTDNVSRMDWCSYVVECMVKECSGYQPYKFFSGPLLLLVIIYVNSTTSETVKVEKTVPAFKAWSSKLLLERQKEELALGFGCLPIAEGVEVIEPPMKMIEGPMKKKKLGKKQKKSVAGDEEGNIANQLQTPKIDLKYGLYGTIDMEEASKEFRSKSFEEMKGIIRDNMVLCNQLMLDIDYKLMIASRINPEDEELKKLVEIRKDLFAESYNEHGHKNGDDATNDYENDGNCWENVDVAKNQNEQMGDQNKEDGGNDGDKGLNKDGIKDDLNESRNKKTSLNESHDLIDMKYFLEKVSNKEKKDDIFGTNREVSGQDLVATKYNAIVPFDIDLNSSQGLSQSTNENENQSQEMQFDYLEDIVQLPESQEPNLMENTFSSNNKRRKLDDEDVTLSQLSWAIKDKETLNETEMVDQIVKLPFLSTGITDEAKQLAADAPSAIHDKSSANADAPSAIPDEPSANTDAPSAIPDAPGSNADAPSANADDAPSATYDAPSANADDAPSATYDAPSATATKAAIATQPYHSTKLKLKRNSSGKYDVEKDGNSNEAKNTTVDAAKELAVHVINAIPVSSVAPVSYIPFEKIEKEKEVAAATKKQPVKWAKKVATNEEPVKKGRGKKEETKKEMVKPQKAPTKKPEPKADKEDIQKVKRVQKRGAKAVVEDKEDDILKEKRIVKPSNAMKSPYYDRKVHIYKKWSEADMKLIEYMWSDSCPESEIVFESNGLQIEGVFFLSLYPEVEVAAPVIDIWSKILNYEERFRDDISQKRSVYCSTLMLPHRMVDFEEGNELERRRKTFQDNLNCVLKNSGVKDINDVGLIFFPCIKITESGSNHYYLICFNMKNGNIDILDNVDNGIEDVSVRYGKYAQALIDTFVNYLERIKHPKVAEIWLSIPKMVPLKWKTTYNAADCGIFVMRHMETYLGEGVFLFELQDEGVHLKKQVKMLRAKYLAKILLKDVNDKKKKLMKEAEAFCKKQGKKSKILTHVDVKVDANLMKMFNDTLIKTLE